MNKVILVVFILASVIYAGGVRSLKAQNEFPYFLEKFGKQYTSSEEQMYRFKIFSENFEKISSHNSLGLSYWFGVNEFTDLTQKEFVDRLTMPPRQFYKRRILADFVKLKADDNVDWTTKGAVSPVKDQGACGSCYTFSVVSAVESAYFIKHGEMKLFSEQQIVDCANTYGCMGCSGGWMVDAFKYIVDHGLCTEDDYPYTASEQKCKDTLCVAAVHLSSYVDVPPTEIDLAKAVSITPVSIALDATPMQLYSGGIYDGKCDPNLFNHAVLVVGYGIENNIKYWKIKNSWGKNWGESGYYRLIKDDGSETGRCGVAAITSYPVAE